MLEPISSLVLDVGSPDDPSGYTPGWSILLDPNNCPTQYLPYCGMFVGVFVPPGMPDAQARAQIKARAGWYRGTLGAIVMTAKQYLTGTQSCQIVEREGLGGTDAYYSCCSCDPSNAQTRRR